MTLVSSLSLRGARTYLHSTTLFDFILREIGAAADAPTGIDFTMHRMTANQVRLTEDKSDAPDASLVARYKDSRRRLFVVDAGIPIERREEYREQELLQRFTVADAVISVPSWENEPYGFIDRAVAAYKHLLQVRFPEGGGKYVFARLTLANVPDEGFSIRYRRQLPGQFYEGVIERGGERLGSIYFAEAA